MKNKIDIRKASNAKSGLHDLCQYIKNIKDTKDLVIVEIGAFAGQSAEIFSCHFKKVISIDPWESHYDKTGVDKASDPNYYNMEEVEKQFDKLCENRDNIVKMKMSSEDAVKIFDDKSVDVVYVDGNHNYLPVKDDINNWFNKIKIGGFIAGHDYKSKHFPGVHQAVKETIGKPDSLFKDSSWIKRKV
ncbi:MAG: class I SAM-dependent methyltransferase [bacterium]